MTLIESERFARAQLQQVRNVCSPVILRVFGVDGAVIRKAHR